MPEIDYIYRRVWDTVANEVKVEVEYRYNNEILETKLFTYNAPFPTLEEVHTEAQAYCQTLFTARKDGYGKVLEFTPYMGKQFTETVT